jgi:hypothetical protein
MGVPGCRGQAVVVPMTPVLILCCIGLRSERGFGELIWQLPTLGPGAPFFLLEPAVGRVIESVWALARGHLITQCAMPF